MLNSGPQLRGINGMKLGLGLYRHMLTRENFQFARQAGATHLVIHLVDYFKGGAHNPRDNQPTGTDQGWGLAGNPDQLWTLEELIAIRHAVEAEGLTLEAIENDKMIENISDIEKYLRERLKEIEEVVAVHGNGGLIGIEFAESCKPFHAKLLENNIITGTSSNPKVLRLLPPLCVKKEEIDLLIEALRK